MLRTDRQRRTCEKYSARDETGLVHCCDCPLRVGEPGEYDFRCRANSHYDRKCREWVADEEEGRNT